MSRGRRRIPETQAPRRYDAGVLWWLGMIALAVAALLVLAAGVRLAAAMLREHRWQREAWRQRNRPGPPPIIDPGDEHAPGPRDSP